MDTPQVLLEHHLKQLRLPTMLREYGKLAEQCAKEKVDFQRFLLRLVELEIIDREHRATERRIKAAKFPTTKSLDTFDFLAIPSLNKKLVLDLARCEWIHKQENTLAFREFWNWKDAHCPGAWTFGLSTRNPCAIHNRGSAGSRADGGTR